MQAIWILVADGVRAWLFSPTADDGSRPDFSPDQPNDWGGASGHRGYRRQSAGPRRAVSPSDVHSQLGP